MARRDLSRHDASDYAASELEYIIRSDKQAAAPKVRTVTAEQAMNEARVFQSQSSRDVTRVLFISQNTELLNPTQQSLDGYINISDLFDEVHILILRQGITPRNPVLRVAHNVWLYTATAKFWWLTPSAGMEMIEEQLEFASGFRPDLIVARDPFESALVATRIGRKYGRPTQLHVLDDYTTDEFSRRSSHNFYRKFLPRFTIPKFLSVRTQTSSIQGLMVDKFSITDLTTLPRYQNYQALVETDIRINLKEKYKPFIFFMVFVGYLGEKSSLHRILDAAHQVLRNPRVGLIVIGDGPMKDEFEKRAKTFGISGQVVFESRVKDEVPYLKSANILLVGDTDFESEELVLKGAAAGVPMILSRTEKREDTFKHGTSAFLCDETDVGGFTGYIDELLNDVELRSRFKRNAQEIIRRQFFGNPSEYLEAYRTTIEQALFVGSDEESEAGSSTK